MSVRLILALSLLVAAASSPAAGQQKAATSPPKPAAEERICETITMIGSRLARKTFCGTKAEWEDRKLQDRQAVERAQWSHCVPNGRTCK